MRRVHQSRASIHIWPLAWPQASRPRIGLMNNCIAKNDNSPMFSASCQLHQQYCWTLLQHKTVAIVFGMNIYCTCACRLHYCVLEITPESCVCVCKFLWRPQSITKSVIIPTRARSHTQTQLFMWCHMPFCMKQLVKFSTASGWFFTIWLVYFYNLFFGIEYARPELLRPSIRRTIESRLW